MVKEAIWLCESLEANCLFEAAGGGGSIDKWIEPKISYTLGAIELIPSWQLTGKSEQVFDGEPRDTDGLDEGQLWVVDGLAFGVPVLDGRDRVEGHTDGRCNHEYYRYHRDHLK